MNVVGLISGTSADGIDASLVEIHGQGYEISLTQRVGLTFPYPPEIQQRILAVAAGQALSVEALALLDDQIAACFAAAVTQIQAQSQDSIDLVASHGQTVFHRPPQGTSLGYSVQLGRGAAIAHHTGLPTVSNFRQADLAVGGQAAPLVPPVDICLLSHPKKGRCIQNIGGIGNVTYLPAGLSLSNGTHLSAVKGWDTGPGNSLLDIAVQALSNGQIAYDCDGAWAAQGTIAPDLVSAWMEHEYFYRPPPKSTGRELFGWEFFQSCQRNAIAAGLSDADLLATLTEFTAISIAHSYQQFLPISPDEVLLCGGGSRNRHLVDRLQAQLPSIPVTFTDQVGVPADYKEAIAFAVLGYWRWHHYYGNLPSVTGARRYQLLGEVALP